MNTYRKSRYLLPLTMAASLACVPSLRAQEGIPEEAEPEVGVETTAATTAEPDAELAGEAPDVEVSEPTPELPAPASAPEEAPAAAWEAATEAGAEVAPQRTVDIDSPAPAAETEAEAEAGVEAEVNPAPTPPERERTPRDGRDRDIQPLSEAEAAEIDARFSQDLGIEYAPIDDDIGFRISGLRDEGITARAGFREGDRVVRIGERDVRGWADFRRAMSGYYGSRAPVYVIREGRRLPIYIDLTDYERPVYLQRVYELDREQRAGFGIGLNQVGDAVVVSRVYPNSPAALAGMRVGDVIVSANGREIETVLDVTGYIRSLSPGDDLVLQVRRQGQNLRVASRLTTWTEALDTAPPTDVLHAELPDHPHISPFTRMNELEERIQKLEEAVRGLRKELSGLEAPAPVVPTEPQQRDVEVVTPPLP